MKQQWTCLLAGAALLLNGCASLTLTDASVAGPADAPLPRVSDDVDGGTLVVRPYLVAGDEEWVRGEIGDHYGDEMARFSWTVPAHQVGGSIDFVVSRNFALVLGGNYARDDFDDYWGGSLGLAVFETRYPAIAWRIDATLALQEMACTAGFIAEPFFDGPSEALSFAKTDALRNTSIMMTLNTRMDGPFNVFINGGLGSKRYFDFDGAEVFGTGDQLDFTGRYAFWSPGAFFSFDGKNRLLAGVRFHDVDEIQGADPVLRQFFLQLELPLGGP